MLRKGSHDNWKGHCGGCEDVYSSVLSDGLYQPLNVSLLLNMETDVPIGPYQLCESQIHCLCIDVSMWDV